MNVTYSNPQTGERKLVKVGFSWPLFLFTEFYGLPLFIRGLHMHGAIVAGFGIFSLLVQQTPLLPVAGLLLIGSMVFYGIKGNELTMRHLERKGWIREDGMAFRPQTFPQPAPSPTIPGEAGPPSGTDMDEAATKPCPRCAEVVKAAALVCKHCGYTFPSSASFPQPTTQPSSQSSLLKTLAIVGAVLIGLIVIGAIVDSDEGTAISKPGGTSTAPTAQTHNAPPARQVTAIELYRAYDANEQAAQSEYGKQPLIIEGIIASIQLDAADQPMVALTAGPMLEEVKLHFGDDFATEAAKLRKGDWFSAECKQVSEILGAPQLDSCTMIMDE